MYPIWHWCLNNDFNLYIEKPMGLTTHQAEALAHRFGSSIMTETARENAK